MKKVVFCSNCGSTNIKPIYSLGSIDNRVQCMDCSTIELPIEGTQEFYEKFLEKMKNE